LGYPQDKLQVHYIGTDVNRFKSSPQTRDSNLVLFVGRLVEKKGCEYLMRAMELVQIERPESKLVVIGDGPLRQSLECLARTTNIRCSFLGAQPSASVAEWLGRARVFCAPSVTAANGDSEGLGLVFAEAQATGTPVVSFKHGGVPEVVRDGDTGLLAAERDHQGLARHLYANCRALLFAADEDFGIVPVEAQSFGRPVVAYGAGGSQETVIPISGRSAPHPTGVFFSSQTTNSVIDGILNFERNEEVFEPTQIQQHARRFGTEVFSGRIMSLIGSPSRSNGSNESRAAAYA
jgi:glycosyltransferase involved in cell wall biosynthesis